jgi:hypothetical protein
MNTDEFLAEHRAVRTPTRLRYDHTLLLDLIAVLEANPKGLRRWSVMRAMRTRRARAGHEITPKFEDEVERLFREYCATEPPRENETRPFFRPKETAGEVWASHADRIGAFLKDAVR